MAVDFLRSTHRQSVRMVKDNGRISVARWFFCLSNAKILPVPSSFGSLVWETLQLPVGPIGQVDRLITWDKGTNRGYCGQRFQGEPQWYISGIPASVMAAPDPLLFCGRQGIFSLGGAELDGSAAFHISTMSALGGAELDGSAAFHISTMSALGGAELDGSAGSAVGGVQANGSATFDQMPFASQGGVEANGSADFFC